MNFPEFLPNFMENFLIEVYIVCYLRILGGEVHSSECRTCITFTWHSLMLLSYYYWRINCSSRSLFQFLVTWWEFRLPTFGSSRRQFWWVKSCSLLYLIRVYWWSLSLMLAQVTEWELIQIFTIKVFNIFETHPLFERAVWA